MKACLIAIHQGQVNVPKDGGKHVVKIVGYPAGQKGEGFHLLGLLDLFLQDALSLIGLNTGGDIPHDQKDAAEPLLKGFGGDFHKVRGAVFCHDAVDDAISPLATQHTADILLGAGGIFQGKQRGP